MPADDSTETQGEIALCLSGGGYRAMLFHLGALQRLNELGYVQKLSRVSSVSGGSITAGVLGMNWGNLKFVDSVATNFDDEVVAPIQNLAGKTIDIWGGIFSITQLSRFSNRIVAAYRKYLFKNRTLQNLPLQPKDGPPEGPRFVINATNLQSGALWRFSQPYMRDYQVGGVCKPEVELAVAVAASSAFPPVLSPVWLKLKPEDYFVIGPEGKRDPRLLTKVVLTDGGVYDNLGLEAVKNPKFKTVLVSDGGGQMAAKAKVPATPGRQLLRVLAVIDNQVRSLRKRHLVEGFQDFERGHQLLRELGASNQKATSAVEDLLEGKQGGTYWGMRTNIANYKLSDALDCPVEKTLALAATPTRLAKLSRVHQERIMNWGYAVADAGMRKYVAQKASAPRGFPYPKSGLG